MRWLLLFMSLSSPALAQTALERIEPRLSRAIAEHRVFFTCASLEIETFAAVQKTWEGMVDYARTYLVMNSTPLPHLQAFDQRTVISGMIRKNQLLGDVIKLCREEHKDWWQRYVELKFTWRIDDEPLP
jgi:hypothetical protein